MSKTVKDIVPEITLANRQKAELELYANFLILRDTLKDGKDLVIVVGGQTLTFTKGILTNVV